ncbi:MAG: enoyl-CoA hydratase-related protein [Myxococcota bacterium]
MPELTLARDGDVAILTLDDGKANALRPSNLAALDAALTEALAARALCVRGRAGFFCAGFDLKAMPGLDRARKHDLLALFSRVMHRIATYPRPTVAAVGGHAFGGGALLALACDVRLAADGPFRFATNEVAIGVPMPTLGVEICRSALAGAALVETLMHGRVWTLPEARDRGVVEALHADVDVAALVRAQALAKLPGEAYAATKARTTGAAMDAAAKAMEAELPAFVDAFEAMAAR